MINVDINIDKYQYFFDILLWILNLKLNVINNK